MKVRNYREVSPQTELPGIALHTVISQPDGAPRFAMRVFEVQPGSSTPFHTHAWEHEVFILSGKGKVRGKDGEWDLQPNDAVFVAPHEEHCFINSGDDLLCFICCIPHPESLPQDESGCEG